MADAATYEIDIQVDAVGADAAAADVNALAASLEAADAVATPFDDAISAANKNLEEAAAASSKAAAALDEAKAEYSALERASTKAAKAVERAANKGKDTTKLQAAADAAAAAVRKQAAAVDAAAGKAAEAAAAESKLAGSLKTLEKAAEKAAGSIKPMHERFDESTKASAALFESWGPLIGRTKTVIEGLGQGGMGNVLPIVTFGLAAAANAAFKLVTALAAGVVGLLAFAVASNKAVSKKFSKGFDKIKEGIKGLFSEVKVDKLLKPFEGLVKLFDKNNAGAKALRGLIAKMLNPLIGGIEKATPILKELWVGGVVGAIKFATFMVRVRNAVLRAIPKSVRTKIKELVSSLTGGITAFDVAKVAVMAFAAALAFLVTWATLVIVFVGSIVAAIMGLVAAVIYVAGAIIQWATSFDSVGALLSDLGAKVKAVASAIGSVIAGLVSKAGAALGKLGSAAAAAGQAFVTGLVNAIKSGASSVLSAAKSLAEAPVKAVKSALQIGSPSKVMMEQGGHVVEGFAAGIAQGDKQIAGSVEQMTSPLDNGGGIRAGKPAARTGGSTFQITINAPTGDGDDIARALEQWLTATFDAQAIAVGASDV